MFKLDFIKTTQFDYSVKNGVTFNFNILVKDNSGIVDVTGFTGEIFVYNHNVSTFDEVVTIAGAPIAGTDGIMYFESDSTETAALPVGRFRYHLNIIDGVNVHRLSEGLFEVNY